MGEQSRIIIKVMKSTHDGDEEWRAAMLFLAKGPSATLQYLKEEPRALLYAYKAQALDGPCPTGQDGSLTIDPSLRAKQEVWKALGDMSKAQAKKEYIDLLTQVLPEWKVWHNNYATSLQTKEPTDEASKILHGFHKRNIALRSSL
eukprot:Gb_34433 [translate_table: standard]